MWWLLGGRAGVAARRGHLGPEQSQMPRGVVGAQTAWCRSHVTRDRGFARWCVLVCVCVHAQDVLYEERRRFNFLTDVSNRPTSDSSVA